MTVAENTRLPTYFIGHGGVSIMFKPEHEAVRQGLRELGKQIKALKPEAVVLTCGEFEGESDAIQVNFKEPTKVWHDLGPSWRKTFPHVFEYEYEHKSSRALAEKVFQHLQSRGVKVESTERDLDHGVWVPFKLMFPEGDELDVPILQISTYAGDDLHAHVELGKALSTLPGRILLIGSGMLCHNLPATRQGTSDTSIALALEAAAKTALDAPTPEERTARFLDLKNNADWINAHPTPEHVLPLYMTLGAGHDLGGYEVWNEDKCIIGQSYYTFRLGALPTD